MATMKAVRIHKFGGPEVLTHEDAPKPEPKEGEVLIKVAAAGVNPVDLEIEAGEVEPLIKHSLPLIIGWDVAGTVAALGAGVTNFTVGDAVFALTDLARDGAYAEFVAVDAATVSPKPSTLSFTDASSVPGAGTTAWQALYDYAGLQSGQTVLVHGGGGAVGAFAVQFAKISGAKVVATATGDDIAYVRGLGADTVVDYKAEHFEDAAKDVDVVLDILSGDTRARSWATLKGGGILISIMPDAAPPPDAAARGIQGKSFDVKPDAEDLAGIAALIDAGKVKTRVGQTFPLSGARAAQERAKGGHTQGKIVLII